MHSAVCYNRQTRHLPLPTKRDVPTDFNSFSMVYMNNSIGIAIGRKTTEGQREEEEEEEKKKRKPGIMFTWTHRHVKSHSYYVVVVVL
jgi:hypothetical protein